MRILFIHSAFPGPFRYLATHLASQPGCEVWFASEHSRRDISLPDISHIQIEKPKNKRRPQQQNKDKRVMAEYDFSTALQRGAIGAGTLETLRNGGFRPDIIYFSAAMGNSFYIKDVFPDAFTVVYAEWYYRRELRSTFQNGQYLTESDFAPARVRNLLQSNALIDCDLAVTATDWQKQQFPGVFTDKMHVLHGGVDTSFFSPDPDPVPEKEPGSGPEQEIVTFFSRGLDTFRGFPQFFNSLPRLLHKRPQCHVQIVATSLPQKQMDELKNSVHTTMAFAEDRIHILGFCPMPEYKQLLQKSSLHVYLTTPFTLSLGLFEAMSCGCLVLGSDTAPVREIITHGQNGFLCHINGPETLANSMCQLLEQRDRHTGICQAARQTILDNYDQQLLANEHAALLFEQYSQWRQRQERI